MTYTELERRLKRQISETVAANDTVLELPQPADYKAWSARWRKHIRCMIWWDELNDPEPKLGRRWFCRDTEAKLFYPWTTEKGEWRRREPNPPKEVPIWNFFGDRIVVAPGLFVPRKGTMLLDGSHRVQSLEPWMVVVDAIEVTTEQLRSIADTLGSWWQ